MAGTVISLQRDMAQPVDETTSRRWSLNRPAFDALLTALGRDREAASARYTALHERLVRFFQWNNAEDADTMADETLDRLARRILADGETANQGSADAVKEPEKFAAGIARLLLHEHWRHRQRQDHAMQALKQEDLSAKAAEKQEAETLTRVLDECLQELPGAQRELIQKYYGTEGQNQIEARKRLAVQYRISLNALRNRAMRIRADLEGRASAALRK